MADAKISALTALTTPSTDDLLVIVDDPSGTPVTKKITMANVAAYLAALTESLTGKTLVSPIFSGSFNGWTEVTDSWSYSSSVPGFTITVPSGAGSKYRKLDVVRYKQGGGYKYGIIYGVADTLLTVSGGSDYSVANSAITDVAYSHGFPLDFPSYLNIAVGSFTTSGTAFTNQPTNDLFRLFLLAGGLHVRGLFHTHGTSGGTGIFYVNTTAGQLPTFAHNDAEGVCMNINDRTKSGMTYITSGVQNKIEIQKYDGTAIAGNGQYVGYDFNYFV